MQRIKTSLFEFGQIPEKIVLHEGRVKGYDADAARRKDQIGQAGAAIADDPFGAGEKPDLFGEGPSARIDDDETQWPQCVDHRLLVGQAAGLAGVARHVDPFWPISRRADPVGQGFEHRDGVG